MATNFYLHLTTALVGILPLVGVLASPIGAMARDDDSSYEREERRTTTRLSEQEQERFRAFLDAHDETAQELYRNPELITNERFLKGHRDLRDWLEDHPDTARAIQADPRAVIWQERGAKRGEREESRAGATRMSEGELRSFEKYLDTHDETAQQLYQNPALINDRRFVRDHDALKDWLQDHPQAAQAIKADPDRYLWRERNTTAQDFLRGLLGR